MLQKISKT